MAPKLYGVTYSPPVRAVRCAEIALKLKFIFINVNLHKGEQRKEEFVKLNPQHKVPTLVEEDGTVVADSHAIMIYLVEKYGKDDSLYPKNPLKRAKVNHRLFFDAAHVFTLPPRLMGPIRSGQSKTLPEDVVALVKETYGMLNTYLTESKWVAGNEITIADFSLIASISSLDLMVPIEDDKYPKVRAWLKKAANFPCFEPNTEGLATLKTVFAELLSQIQ